MVIVFEKLKIALDNITLEDMEKYFPADTKPKGWISVEDALPRFLAKDFYAGCTYYKVKFDNE